MSMQIALDAINLRPASRLAHTEYSMEYHGGYIRKVTGLDPSDPGAFGVFRDKWMFDFIWSSNDGLHGDWLNRGRATDMGHAEYAADGSDMTKVVKCPFQTAEEVWAFDAVKEFGLPDFSAQVNAYETSYADTQKACPNQLVPGGYYKTIVSGAIQAFGWDMFLMAAADQEKMERVLDSIFRFTLHHMEAWARTSVKVVIQHDDFVWSSGAFLHPEFYRKVIIPRYAELWKPLHRAGKKVLFCADGTFMEFAEDIVKAGADGLIFEPSNDFQFMAERFGQSHCLVGSCVDCRDMTFGAWDTVRRQLDRTLELARKCKGVILAVGNHIPANVSDDICDKYISHLRVHMGR